MRGFFAQYKKTKNNNFTKILQKKVKMVIEYFIAF